MGVGEGRVFKKKKKKVNLYTGIASNKKYIIHVYIFYIVKLTEIAATSNPAKKSKYEILEQQTSFALQ